VIHPNGTSAELRILRTELLEAHRELSRLRMQNEQLMASNRDLSTLLVTTERRSGDLVRVIVAFRRLLESADSASALRSIEEIMINVIGTEDFAVLLLTEADDLRAVAGMGVAVEHARVYPPTLKALSRSQNSHIVPLHIAESLVGAIIIDELLPHRDALNANDDQVLSLLSKYAATAVLAADHKKLWKRVPLTEVA
jgi:hypothetical protein